MLLNVVLFGWWLFVGAGALDQEASELHTGVVSLSADAPARLRLAAGGLSRTRTVYSRRGYQLCLEEGNERRITYHHCPLSLPSKKLQSSSIALLESAESFNSDVGDQISVLEAESGVPKTPADSLKRRNLHKVITREIDNTLDVLHRDLYQQNASNFSDALAAANKDQAISDSVNAVLSRDNATAKATERLEKQHVQAAMNRQKMTDSVEERNEKLAEATAAQVSKQVSVAKQRLDTSRQQLQQAKVESKIALEKTQLEIHRQLKSNTRLLTNAAKESQAKSVESVRADVNVRAEGRHLIQQARLQAQQRITAETKNVNEKQKQSSDNAVHAVDAALQSTITSQEHDMEAWSKELIRTHSRSSAYGGIGDRSTIQSSKDSFFCVRKFFDQAKHLKKFQYIECHHHAKCYRRGESLSCQCKPGYHGNGHRCAAVNCGILHPPANGVVRCLQGTGSGKKCSVSCKNGYALSGSSEYTCLVSGKWNLPKKRAQCIPIACTPPATPEHGLQHCTGIRNADTCRFRCESGYKLHGDSLITCQQSGKSFKGVWFGEQKGDRQCNPVDCRTPMIPSGASVNCPNGTTFGQHCHVTCGGDDKAKGATMLRCQANGRWDGELLSCNKLSCPKLDDPADGHLVCNGRGINDRCSLVCNEGYASTGKVKRVCKYSKIGLSKTAAWTGTMSTCERIRCNKNNPLINGEEQCQGQASGHSCVYKCHSGYVLSGSSTRTCRSNGKWDGEEPKCTNFDCGKHAPVQNGNTVCDGSKYGHKCHFSCSKGYQLVGPSVRICEKDGFWSGGTVACKPIVCPLVEDPVNGRVECTGSSYGDTCSIACNHGYLIQGSSSISCGVKGWSRTNIMCKPMKCDHVTEPIHGAVHCTGREYGSTCAFSCNEGYEVDGPDLVRRCKASGDWSGNPISCMKRDCGELTVPINGQKDCPTGTMVNSTCNFRCNHGYQLISNASRQRKCNPRGYWTGKMAECQRIDCGKPRAQGMVANCKSGTTVGERCSLQCASGYEPVSPTTECLDNGQWSGPLNCTKLSCSKPLTPQNGAASCEGYKLGERCNFKCDDGYQLEGSPSRYCNERGEWGGPPAKCVQMQCPKLKNSEGLMMKCDSGDESTGLITGAKCKFSCSTGLKLQGSAERVCSSKGKWSGTAARCTKAECDPPTARQGCDFQCDAGHAPGDTCKIIPHFGFQLSNNRTSEPITCRDDSQWSRTSVKCIPLRCPALLPPLHGRHICTGKDQYGSKCGLQCNVNMFRSGLHQKECNYEKRWTPGPMECKPIPRRMHEYMGMGDVQKAFTFYSDGGNVGLRLESLDANKANNVLIKFLSWGGAVMITDNGAVAETSHGHKPKSWMVGMMSTTMALSICYGTEEAYSCALRITADGEVHLLAAPFFHGHTKAVPRSSSKHKEHKEAAWRRALVETLNEKASTDGRSSNPTNPSNELQEDDVLLLQEEITRPSLDGEQGNGAQPSYQVHVNASPQPTWASDGSVGLRVESKDSDSSHDVYTEFRNQGVPQSFSLGTYESSDFGIGYGLMGSLSTRSQYMKVSKTKQVMFDADVVFHQPPSYFTAERLNIKTMWRPINRNDTAIARENSTAWQMVGHKKYEEFVPMIPESSESSFGVKGSAEPLVSFLSKTDLILKVESLAEKNAFVTLKNKDAAWKFGVKTDGNMYISHNKGAFDDDVIKIDTQNNIHFYGDVSFGGKQMRTYE